MSKNNRAWRDISVLCFILLGCCFIAYGIAPFVRGYLLELSIDITSPLFTIVGVLSLIIAISLVAIPHLVAIKKDRAKNPIPTIIANKLIGGMKIQSKPIKAKNTTKPHLTLLDQDIIPPPSNVKNDDRKS